MIDHESDTDTSPPPAIRGSELAQMRGWASNDVTPPPRRTQELVVSAVVRLVEEQAAPVSESPASLTPRRLERALRELGDHRDPREQCPPSC